MGPASQQAAIGSAELEAALETVQAQAIAGSAALRERLAALRETTVAELAEIEAAEAAAGAGMSLTGVSDAATAAMARLGITQTEVAASAVKLGISEEVAARAMIQLSKARLAEQVEEAAAALETLNGATVTEAETAEAAAVANELDAAALAKRATMMRRTSDGLVDIALGGRRAVQGVADLQYVLMGLFPEGAATIGVIAGIALIGEVWESMSRKMEREHHEATEKIKGNIDEMVKEVETRYLPVLERQLELQKNIQSIQKDQLVDLASGESAKQRGLELDKQIAIEKARQNELVALGNTTDKGEQERIKARFKATETDITSGNDVATAALQLQEKQAEIDATKADLAQQQDAIADLRNQIQAIETQRTADAQFMAEHGITQDEKGILIHKKTDPTGKDISTPALGDLRNEMENAQQRFTDVSNLPHFAQRNPRAFETFKNKAAAATSAYETAGQVQNRALTTDSDKSVADMQKHVEELSATISATTRELGNLAPTLENLKKGVELANRKNVNNEVASTRDEYELNRDQARAKRDRPLHDQEKTIEGQLDDPSLSKELRNKLQDRQKVIRGQLHRNQESDDQLDHPNVDASDKQQQGNLEGALGLAMHDVETAGGLGKGAGNLIGQFEVMVEHIRETAAANRDLTLGVHDLIQEMEKMKAGSQADRDLIRNMISDIRNSPNS